MRKLLLAVFILSVFILAGCVKAPQPQAINLNQAPQPKILPAINQPLTNTNFSPADQALSLAPEAAYNIASAKDYIGQKFRFQGCLEPHTCSGPISSNQKCDIDHLGVCCDCIIMGTKCPIVALESVAKEKLTEIRKTNETKYNVEVVGIVTVGSKMRPIQIEATDLKILGECQLPK